MIMRSSNPPARLGRKMLHINWGLILIITVTVAFGIAMLYSAANGSWEPWAVRQLARYGVGILVLFTVALVDIRFWFRNSYLIYFILLALLVAT